MDEIEQLFGSIKKILILFPNSCTNLKVESFITGRQCEKVTGGVMLEAWLKDEPVKNIGGT